MTSKPPVSSAASTSGPREDWYCRCREVAPDRIGSVPVLRPSRQSRCGVCFTDAPWNAGSRENIGGGQIQLAAHEAAERLGWDEGAPREFDGFMAGWWACWDWSKKEVDHG